MSRLQTVWSIPSNLLQLTVLLNHCLAYLTVFYSYNIYFFWPFFDHCYLPHILAQGRPVTGIVLPPARKWHDLWRLTNSWHELGPSSQSSTPWSFNKIFSLLSLTCKTEVWSEEWWESVCLTSQAASLGKMHWQGLEVLQTSRCVCIRT